MKKGYSHISIVMDRSGSMSVIKNDAEGGLNTLIKTHQSAPGEATLTVAKFDDKYEVEYDFSPIKSVGHVALEPRGMTALLDAIGKTITVTGERLRGLPEPDRPEHVFFVIVTDGQENASREFNRPAIKEMIERQTKDYNWQFVFLGANMDAIGEAQSLGISANSSANFNPSGGNLGRAYGVTGQSMVAMRSGARATLDYSSEDRKSFVVPTGENK